MEGDESDLRRFFYSNVGRRIIRSSGGLDWWEGLIVRMDWTNQGITLVRTLEDLANWTKVVYTKVGDNQLANGDVEDGAWNQVGTPSTHTTYTSWHARGPTSMRVVTDAASEGTQVGDGVGGADTVSVTAGVAYDCSIIVDVQSGTWTLQVLDSGSNVLVQRATGGTGRTWLKCQIPESNTTTDAACTVRLIADGAGAEVYADGAVFRTSPFAADTGWYTDSSSVNEYGRAERIFLEGEMVDAEATGKAQKRLADLAWVRTRPPERGETRERLEPSRLSITAYGYWWTMGWRYLLGDGTQGASTYISNLCSEAEFVSTGSVDANGTDVTILADTPINLWRAAEKVLDVGDGSGSSMVAGVYPGRAFDYYARPSDIVYKWENGRMMRRGGGEIDPMTFRPGWCFVPALMPEPPPAGAGTEDHPDRVWLYQTEFIYRNGAFAAAWAVEQR